LRVVVRYSDSRGIARYEHRRDTTISRGRDGVVGVDAPHVFPHPRRIR
jgi:hypothetical protein